MANNKVEIDVEAKDKKGSVKKLALDSKKAGDGLDKVGNSARNAERNVKGVAQTSSNATKNFSKMAQGTGGLVAAYATLAANIFAISAAYGFLKRAGDLVALTKGQEQYAIRTGKSMSLLTSRLQAATGGLLAFDEASQAAAIGTAAGLGSDQLEGLAKIAKNASVALGRDLTDSFNRLTKGAIKAEPELLDELGIILRLEKANEDYARALDKDVKSLTTFEKSQAVVNAVLKQGNKNFDDVGDNVNQIARLGKAFDDLVKSIMKAVEPFASWISGALADNVEALAAAFGLLGLSISRALIPAGPQMASLASMAESSKAALMGAAAGGTGKYATAMREGDFSKGTLAAIDRGAEATGRGKDSTVVDKNKMNEAQFKKHTAIIKAQHSQMVAANTRGLGKYYQSAKAYFHAMQAEHGKVMGAMKGATAALATGLSKAMTAVAWIGMISVAITMIKEFIEYFKDPALKRMQQTADDLTATYEDQTEKLTDMVEAYKDAETHAGTLVKQANVLNNFSFKGSEALAHNLQASTFSSGYVQSDVFGEGAVLTETTADPGANKEYAQSVLAMTSSLTLQTDAMKKFGIENKATEAQQRRINDLNDAAKTILAGASKGSANYNKAVVVIKSNLVDAEEAGTAFATSLNAGAAAMRTIGQTGEAFDKFIGSLRDAPSKYDTFIQHNNSLVESLTELEKQGKGNKVLAGTLDKTQISIIQKVLKATDDTYEIKSNELTIQGAINALVKQEELIRSDENADALKAAQTAKAHLENIREMAKVDKDIANAKNKVQITTDKIAVLENEIARSTMMGKEEGGTAAKITEANLAVLREQLLTEQDIVDLKTQQKSDAHILHSLSIDSKLHAGQQALLDMDQKRVDLAKERIELLEKEAERANTNAKISYGRSSPFAFLTQDKFEAKADLDLALSQKKAKEDAIEAERKMKEDLIEMEYILLDAKLAALAAEMRMKADDPLSGMTGKQQSSMRSIAMKVEQQRTKLPGLQQQAIDLNDDTAGSKVKDVADNIVRLTEAKEDLSDVKVLTDGIAVSLAEGMGSAFDGLIQGTMNAKQAFASMAQGVLQAIAKIISEMMVAKILSSSLFGAFGIQAPAASTRYGGIVTPAGKAPGYATGGIAKGSQAGYPVMMHGTEAIVPLPNGKSIPVEMTGSGTNNISINVNMDNSGNSQTSGDQGKDTGGKLGKMLAAAVQDELHKQKRPGGLLSPLGATG